MDTLRRKEVAALLGVAVVTVDKWRASGYLPAPIMLGDVPVWDRAELVAWLNSKREVRK